MEKTRLEAFSDGVLAIAITIGTLLVHFLIALYYMFDQLVIGRSEAPRT
jgi:hypothetical protein